MSIFYWLCNSICVLLGTCGLLMQPLKIWQYLVLTIYMTGAGMLGEYFSFRSNFLMITLLLFFLICMVQKNKAANLALACVGYMAGKYSLQGTTQGRYLTGGVPPVRFSM